MRAADQTGPNRAPARRRERTQIGAKAFRSPYNIYTSGDLEYRAIVLIMFSP